MFYTHLLPQSVFDRDAHGLAVQFILTVHNEALQSAVVPERKRGFSSSVGCAVFMKEAGASCQARGKTGTLLIRRLENSIGSTAWLYARFLICEKDDVMS